MLLRRGYFEHACPRFLSSVQKRLTFQSRLWVALVNQASLLLRCCFWRRKVRVILRGRWWRLMGGGRHNEYFSHNLSVRSKTTPLALGGCRSRQGSRKAAVLFGEFVLVSKHTVTTIDIAPGKWLWCVFDEPFTYMWFICVRRVKPGF